MRALSPRNNQIKFAPLLTIGIGKQQTEVTQNIRELKHVGAKNLAFSDQQEIWLKIIEAKKHTADPAEVWYKF